VVEKSDREDPQSARRRTHRVAISRKCSDPKHCVAPFESSRPCRWVWQWRHHQAGIERNIYGLALLIYNNIPHLLISCEQNDHVSLEQVQGFIHVVAFHEQGTQLAIAYGEKIAVIKLGPFCKINGNHLQRGTYLHVGENKGLHHLSVLESSRLGLPMVWGIHYITGDQMLVCFLDARMGIWYMVKFRRRSRSI